MINTLSIQEGLEVLKEHARVHVPQEDPNTNLGFCIRPENELRELERETNKLVGYGHRLVLRSGVQFSTSDDMIGFYYGSAHALEYRSHRFVVGGDDELSYHREPFNIDWQSMGSRVIDLNGIDAVNDNMDALKEFDWLVDRATELIDPATVFITSRIRTVSCPLK